MLQKKKTAAMTKLCRKKTRKRKSWRKGIQGVRDKEQRTIQRKIIKKEERRKEKKEKEKKKKEEKIMRERKEEVKRE